MKIQDNIPLEYLPHSEEEMFSHHKTSGEDDLIFLLVSLDGFL